MNWALIQHWKRSGALTGAALTVFCGLALWKLPVGTPWIRTSYDLPCFFGQRASPRDVVIIGMDQESHGIMGIPHGQWPRSVHARLLAHLHADQARLIVLDVALLDTNAPAEDAALAEALARSGPVVLDAVRVPSHNPDFPGEFTQRPTNFLTMATDWGIGGALPDRDLAVRRLFTGTNTEPSLAWSAARLTGGPLPDLRQANRQVLWLRYCGPPGTIPYVSYHRATNQEPGFYRDKTVFIGGKPSPLFLDEKADVFRTPFTLRQGQMMSGVELAANMYLNLVHGRYLRRTAAWIELGLLVMGGVLVGGGLSLMRPVPALGLALAAMLFVTVLGISLFWITDQWGAWMVMAGGQIPFALAWSVLYRTQQFTKAADRTSHLPAASGQVVGPVLSPGQAGFQPAIPEHTLLRRIGEGAYGEVWLARDVVGSYHAVKVVYLHTFGNNTEPFEREYRGLSEYAPISFSHRGLLHVLFVGRCEVGGYFYYIMELADDAQGKVPIEPFTYKPRNLEQELAARQHLPVPVCIEIAWQLAAALDHLHHNHLVHRDIKPSNIVFVKGVPKLADIGLVTRVATPDHDVSYVGTEGYIPPEGPGSRQADIYSLGVVLYRMSTGLQARQCPTPSDTLGQRPDFPQLLRLNQVIAKACSPVPADRYASASDMAEALREVRCELDAMSNDSAIRGGSPG